MSKPPRNDRTDQLIWLAQWLLLTCAMFSFVFLITGLSPF